MPGLRVVVVGSGVVGACVAYSLARRGAAVTIVERSYPGAATSGHTFASLGSFGQEPLHFHTLHVRSTPAHERLAGELGGDWLHMDGALYWRSTLDPSIDAFEATIRRESERGVTVQDLSPSEAMALEPDLVVEPSVKTVYRLPGDGWLSGVPLAHSAGAAAQRRGASAIIGEPVVDLIERSGRVAGVRLEGGRTIEADMVVNATGPAARQVAAMAGVELSLGGRIGGRVVGAVVVSEPAPVRLRHVVKVPATHVHPDGGGRLMFYLDHYAATFPEDARPGPDHPLGQEAMDDAAAILPGLRHVRAEAIRVGVRAEPFDGLPLIGESDGFPGLYHAVTRSGITLCALLGELIATDLTGGDADLGPYRPDAPGRPRRGTAA